jgi:hypothetical protein
MRRHPPKGHANNLLQLIEASKTAGIVDLPESW